MKKRKQVLLIIAVIFSSLSFSADFDQIFEKSSDYIELDESKDVIAMPDIDNLFIDDNLDIFMADIFAGNIKRWSKDGKLIMIYGGPGQGPGEFQKPFIVVVKNDSAIVSDFSSKNNVTIFDRASGKFLSQEKIPSSCHMLNLNLSGKIFCGSLNVKGKDKVYIINDDFQIERIFFDPKIITEDERSLTPIFPMDFDARGNTYISTYLSYKFAKYDKSQNLIGVFGTPAKSYIQPQDTTKTFLDKNKMNDYMQQYCYLRKLFVLKDKYVLLIFTTPKSNDEWYLDLYTVDGKKIFSGIPSTTFFIGKNHGDELYSRIIEDQGTNTVYKICKYRLRDKIE